MPTAPKRTTRMDLDGRSGHMMPPSVQTTTFTAPAYSSSTCFNNTSSSSGIWGAICFFFGTLFGFKGRVSRLDYWVIGTAYTLTSIVGYLAFGMAAGSFEWGVITSPAQEPTFIAQFFVFCFAMIMLRLSLEARRFQDRGLSGYWYFGYLIPVLNIYLFFANSFFSGTPGGNRYDL